MRTFHQVLHGRATTRLDCPCSQPIVPCPGKRTSLFLNVLRSLTRALPCGFPKRASTANGQSTSWRQPRQSLIVPGSRGALLGSLPAILLVLPLWHFWKVVQLIASPSNASLHDASRFVLGMAVRLRCQLPPPWARKASRLQGWDGKPAAGLRPRGTCSKDARSLASSLRDVTFDQGDKATCIPTRPFPAPVALIRIFQAAPGTGNGRLREVFHS